MTTIYEVDMHHRGTHFRTIRVAEANDAPELACECAERIVCESAEGSLYNLPDYFAGKVRALTATELLR